MSEETLICYGKAHHRRLRRSHVDECVDRDCDGCQPCEQDHCRLCGRVHVTPESQTCPACIADLRDDLARIGDAWAALPAEAVEGPHATDGDVPGGLATLLLGPWTAEPLRDASGASASEPVVSTDPVPPGLVLLTTADDWADHLGIPAPSLGEVPALVDWLDERAAMVAADHPAIDEAVAELRALRRTLERVTGAGPSDKRGDVRCMQPLASGEECGARLTRIAQPRRHTRECHGHGPLHVCTVGARGCCDTGGLADEWECPRCHDRLTAEGYLLAAAEQARRDADWLTADDLAMTYAISPATIRQWASRGRVRKRRYLGRAAYSVADVRGLLDTPDGDADGVATTAC